MRICRNEAVSVILPENPTPRELFAAKELEKYMGQMLNAQVTDDARIRFIIGDPARNPAAAVLISQQEFRSLLTGEEGMLILIRGNAVLISGSVGFPDQQRGTVYAVYEFLERYAGCVLAAFCDPKVDVGEHVPVLHQLDLEDDCYVKTGSDRPYRCAIVEYGDKAGNPDHGLNIPFLDWLVKNRYNRILTWCSIYEGWKELGLIPEIEKRGIRLTVGHHDAVRMWLPFDGNSYFPEEYSKTHPEYYRLNADGSRFYPDPEHSAAGQWVFCSRNQECIRQVSENIIHWIRENPVVDIIALWPMDNRQEQCSCPDCAPYSNIENYAYFQNEVALRVAKVHPLIKMDMLLYTTLWECPDGLKLNDSLFCDMSTWAASGLRSCGKPDGSCLADTHFTQTLLKWKEHGSQVAFYDYYMGVFSCRQRLIPMADELQSLWRFYKEKEIMGSGTQLECFHIWNHLVNVYCFARIGYDNSLSMEQLLDMLSGIFGEGAPYIVEIYTMIEKIVDGQVPIHETPDYLMEYVDRELVYDLYEKALDAASTARWRNNIRLMRMVFRYSDLEYHDPGHNQKFSWLLEYEDATGELAYMATNFDSFEHNYTGYAIAFPLSNTDTKNFVPDKWYQFE